MLEQYFESRVQVLLLTLLTHEISFMRYSKRLTLRTYAHFEDGEPFQMTSKCFSEGGGGGVIIADGITEP